MRKLFAIAISLLCLSALASPTRSDLGAEWNGRLENWNPTAADYIQDGLVAMWDAIENGGPGIHDPTLNKATWVEWCGTGWKIDSDRGGFFEDDWFGQEDQNSGICVYSPLREVFNSSYTAEYVYGNCYFFDDTISKEEILGGKYGGVDGRPIFYFMSPSRLFYLTDRGQRQKISLDDTLHLAYRADLENLVWMYDGYISGNHLTMKGSVTGSGNTTYFYFQPWMHKSHCLRFYNRVLSDSELQYNRIIDYLRFGL